MTRRIWPFMMRRPCDAQRFREWELACSPLSMRNATFSPAAWFPLRAMRSGIFGAIVQRRSSGTEHAKGGRVFLVGANPTEQVIASTGSSPGGPWR